MEKKSFHFKGIIPPVVTLFDVAGDFDWKANQKLADHLIENRVHGILFMGSTGEFSSLTMNERKTFAEEMIQYVNRRVPVLIGTGTTSLRDTIELSKHAESAGADGVMVVSPYYWKYNNEQLYEYYVAVADSIQLPVLLYNIPLLTGQSMSADLVLKLALSRENIVGIKDTIDNFGHIRQLLYAVKDKRPDFAVFSAFDDQLLPALQMGAAGSINGTSVFLPDLSVKMFESYQNGEYEKSLEYYRSVLDLMPIYQFSEPLFIAIKEAVHQLILESQTGSRPPVNLIDSSIKEKVNRLLSNKKRICNDNFSIR